jgi:hypothetical protein
MLLTKKDSSNSWLKIKILVSKEFKGVLKK